MATSFTYPGVYIQEFAPGAPIAGVGTSTPAFIGPAASGEWNVPTKLTSFDQFVAQYGDQPVPGFYLWYAVRGFFENGGQVCYVVRASNTSYATLPLFDSANVPNPLINVRARQLGIPNPAVSIDVVQTSLLPITPLYQPTGGFALTATNEITMAPPNGQALAAQFRPGDSVHVGPYGEHIIQRISGDIVHFGEDLKLGSSRAPHAAPFQRPRRGQGIPHRSRVTARRHPSSRHDADVHPGRIRYADRRQCADRVFADGSGLVYQLPGHFAHRLGHRYR